MSSAHCVVSSLFLLTLVAGISPAAETSREKQCPASCSLIDAITAIAPPDIAVAAARDTRCPLVRLPASLPKLLRLLPDEHRSLIEECARGRVRMQRSVAGFDLIGIVEGPSEDPAAAAAIRTFFDERAVDVALGRGLSDEPYPISFDWVVVLDPAAGTLYSLILNCHD